MISGLLFCTGLGDVGNVLKQNRITSGHTFGTLLLTPNSACAQYSRVHRMPNFLSQLTKAEQARLLEELNYMNLEEIRDFCSAHGIPYKIMAEYPDRKVKATKDTDRKPIVLARVRHYLTTGQ